MKAILAACLFLPFAALAALTVDLRPLCAGVQPGSGVAVYRGTNMLQDGTLFWKGAVDNMPHSVVVTNPCTCEFFRLRIVATNQP